MLGHRWLQCPWNGAWHDKGIAAKELLPILLAVAAWGQFWQGEQVLVHSDNMSVVNIIAANTSVLHSEPHRQQNPDSNPRATMADSGPITTRLAVAELERLASHFIKDSIAESTRRAYSTGQTTYFNFCTKFNLQPLPAPEQQLILFTADLSQRLSYSSIRSYLSAVRFLHIANGHPDPLAKKLKLDLLLRGLRRRKPGSQDKRLPVTPLILEKIFSVLNKNPSNFENKLLWAACCLGFFGFLRSGEFTTQSDNYDPSWHLSVQDVAVDSLENPSVLQVRIKGSKTDQLRQGMTIVVGITPSHICPVKECWLI